MKTLIICAIVASALGLAAANAGACACSNQLCNLDKGEAALYLDCILTVQGAKLPVSFDFNAIQALDQLSAERQSDLLTTCSGRTVHKLPALNGLNDLQLAILQEQTLHTYATTLIPGNKHAVTMVLTTFTGFTNAQCLSTANGSGL